VAQTGDFEFKITIDFAGVWQYCENTLGGKGADFLASGVVKVKYKHQTSSSGVAWYEAVMVMMDTREPINSTESAKDSASQTFLHELGHYAGIAGKFLPDSSDTVNPNFYSEQSGEVSARGKGGYGVGPHCDGLSDECVMWYAFILKLEYCEACKLFLRARALHSPAVAGRDKL
jgi:hypothetical protein